MKHFIFQEGKWLGEGKIGFSASEEEIHFFTRWTIEPSKKGGSGLSIRCVQEVEMREGASDKMVNRFFFSEIEKNSFTVTLENEQFGSVKGTGIIEPDKIAWEFRGHPHIEGFEVYQQGKEGEWLFHAEYVSPEQYRSIINGKIWKKVKK